MGKGRVEFALHFLIAKDGLQYSALCYEYNIATCADTPKAAFLALIEATVAYLEPFLQKGREPKPRPASRELLLEFLDLDPRKKSYPREAVSGALESVIAGSVGLQAPAAYSLRKRRFVEPIERAIPRLGTGSYPVTIHA